MNQTVWNIPPCGNHSMNPYKREPTVEHLMNQTVWNIPPCGNHSMNPYKHEPTVEHMMNQTAVEHPNLVEITLKLLTNMNQLWNI